MVGPWPNKPFTFRALIKTYGPMWVPCDVCRRYGAFRIAGLGDVDYRTKTFSCSACGAEAYLCLVEPVREMGMEDYRLDEVAEPQRHPEAIERLSGRCRQPTVNHSGGDLPGRKVDPRR
jgi:hypothetical protein